MTNSLDSFKARKTLKAGDREYVYFSLAEAEKNKETYLRKKLAKYKTGR